MVFFDLPVKTARDRREASQFRKFLLNDGYHMIQFSVYARVSAADHGDFSAFTCLLKTHSAALHLLLHRIVREAGHQADQLLQAGEVLCSLRLPKSTQVNLALELLGPDMIYFTPTSISGD